MGQRTILVQRGLGIGLFTLGRTARNEMTCRDQMDGSRRQRGRCARVDLTSGTRSTTGARRSWSIGIRSAQRRGAPEEFAIAPRLRAGFRAKRPFTRRRLAAARTYPQRRRRTAALTISMWGTGGRGRTGRRGAIAPRANLHRRHDGGRRRRREKRYTASAIRPSSVRGPTGRPLCARGGHRAREM